jgi:hypothetical protein
MLRAACCAIAVAAMVAPAARADEYTKLTHLTFSAPVQVPGLTLPAGTYTFKLADPESGRRTIQIWDKEGGNLLATLLTIPDQLMEPADEPVVLFNEQPAGAPVAVKAWFYPGDRYGMEFVYPKDQAMKIAGANRTSVLAYDGGDKMEAEALHKADVGRVDAQGNRTDQNAQASTAATTTADTAQTTTADAAQSTASTAAAASAAPQAAETAGQTAAPSDMPAGSANRSQAGTAVGTSGTQTTTAAQAQTAPAPRTQTAPAQTAAPAQSNTAQQPARPSTAAAQGQTADARPQSLPRTASPIGLFAMLSALSLTAAAGVRQLRRRHAMNR